MQLSLPKQLEKLIEERPGMTSPELTATVPFTIERVSGALAYLAKAKKVERKPVKRPGKPDTFAYWPKLPAPPQNEGRNDMSWETYQNATRKVFPKGTVVEQQRGGVAFHTPCSTGDHTVAEHFNVRMPPDKAVKHLTNKGWQFWGSKSSCPLHNARPEKIAEPRKDEPVTETMQSALQSAGLSANDKVREAKRLATMLLEEKFDVLKGAFRDGFSDAKIANETGVSKEWVGQRREEDFGPIREPAEIAEFRDQVATLDARISNISRNAKAEIDAAVAEIGRLEKSIDVIVRRNGW